MHTAGLLCGVACTHDWHWGSQRSVILYRSCRRPNASCTVVLSARLIPAVKGADTVRHGSTTRAMWTRWLGRVDLLEPSGSLFHFCFGFGPLNG